MTDRDHPAGSIAWGPVPADRTPRLSIVHVHTTLVGSGGDRVSELQARYMAARGHDVTIVAPAAHDIAGRLAKDGIRVVEDAVDDRSACNLLPKIGRVDIVHCHCLVSAPLAVAIAQAAGASLIIHVHSMGEGWWECTDLFSSMSAQRQRLRRSIDRAVAAADRVLCVSDAVCTRLQTLGLPTERAMTLSNPIDDIFFREEMASGPPLDVAILARPSRAKSPLRALCVLAEANRLRPGLRMAWIGPLGRWEPVLRNLAGLLRLKNLTFTGKLPPAEVCNLLDTTTLLLSASNREGQPLSVLEALARGCSALLSDIPGHRMFAGEQGVALFPRRNAAEGGRRLVALLEEGRRWSRPHLASHRAEAHGAKLLTIYEQVVRSHEGGAVRGLEMA